MHGELQMKPLRSTAVQTNNTEKGFVKFCGCPKLCRKGKDIKPILFGTEVASQFLTLAVRAYI